MSSAYAKIRARWSSHDKVENQWTTATNYVTCPKCKSTRAFARSESAGGIHPTGDAPAGPITTAPYFGAKNRGPLNRNPEYLAYLGDIIWTDRALADARRS